LISNNPEISVGLLESLSVVFEIGLHLGIPLLVVPNSTLKVNYLGRLDINSFLEPFLAPFKPTVAVPQLCDAPLGFREIGCKFLVLLPKLLPQTVKFLPEGRIKRIFAEPRSFAKLNRFVRSKGWEVVVVDYEHGLIRTKLWCARRQLHVVASKIFITVSVDYIKFHPIVDLNESLPLSYQSFSGDPSNLMVYLG
jgi:hypothetical protein